MYDLHAAKEGYTSDYCMSQKILQPGETSKRGEIRLHARESRFGLDGLTFLRMADCGEVMFKTFADVDFLGSDRTEESLFTPLALRVRCARMSFDFGSWILLCGQSFSTFNYGDLSDPEILDNSGPGGYVGGGRRPQVRVSYKSSWWLVDCALENPEGEYINKNGETKFAGRVSGSYYASDQLPDVVFAFQGNSEKAEGRLYAMGRKIRLMKADSSPDIVKYGWGVGLSAGYRYCGSSTVYFQGGGGQGIGRYLPEASGYALYLDDQNKAHTMTAFGGLVGIRHHWSETWKVRSSLVFGLTGIVPHGELVSHSYLSDGTTKYADITKQVRSIMVNTFFSPFGPGIDIGIGYLRGERVLKVHSGPNKGSVDRFIITIKGAISS
jgi:hypothetical protein